MEPVFTLGHSSHEAERFLDLLRLHGVAAVLDVRSRPASRFAPQYNGAAMARWLRAAGIAYRWLGEGLGGRPADPGFFDPTGRPDYRRMSGSAVFTAGISAVIEEAAARRVALVCAEKDPANCHRAKLVAPALILRGIAVHHIHADGHVEPHADLLNRSAGPQADLFG